MTIGVGKPIVVLNSELVTAPGRRRPARGARPRGRAHPLRPRPLPDRPDHPAAACRRTCRCWRGCRWCRSATRCSSGSAAELSCDRAAALLTRDPQAVCRTLMVLAAGAAAEHLNLDAFLKQGMDYSEEGHRAGAALAAVPGPPGHPPAAGQARARAARLGARGRLRPHRRRRLHAARRGAAAQGGGRQRRGYYGERVKGAFEKAGTSVSDVGDQLSAWLERLKRAAARAWRPPPTGSLAFSK